MSAVRRRLIPVLLMAVWLAACAAPTDSRQRPSPSPLSSTEEMVAPPALTGTAGPLVIATEVVPTATEIAETPIVLPFKTSQARVAAFGDPVAIGRGGIRDAAFSPDRKTLAIGWTNGVSLTSVADQTDVWYWNAPEMVTAVDASAEHVAALLVNGDVWLFGAEGSTGQRFPGAAKVPRGDASWGDVAWSPDGRLAAIQAVGGADSGATPILLLDPAKREVTGVPGSLTHAGWQPYLAWSPDSRLIASTDQDRQGWALEVSSGEVVYQPQPGAQGGSPRIYAWLPDSTIVVVGAGGEGLRLEDIASGKVVRRMPGAEAGFVPTPPVAISPDGEQALVGGFSLGEYEIQPYQVWDLNHGRLLDAPPVGELRHINSAGCMQLNRPAIAFDGEEAITLDTDGRLMRWQVGEEQGELLGQVPVRYPCLQTPMVWSDDSARVVLESDPGQVITVWDVISGGLLAERSDGTYPADLHGEVLAYRGEDGDLVVWNIEGNHAIGRLPGPVTAFTSGVAFSADGRQIAYGVGNRLHIADVSSGGSVAVLDAYPEGQEISHITWAPSGDALAAASGSPVGSQSPPGILILWEKVGDTYTEAFRTETVQASADPPWGALSMFSPSSRLAALERMPEPVAGQEAVLVYDQDSRAVLLEKQDYKLHQWLSDEALLLTAGCRFIELNVLTGQEDGGSSDGCQAELGAFAPDGVHFSDVLFSGRWVDIMNWRTGQVEAKGYVGSDVQDGIFSPDGRWLLVRAIEGLVRAFPVSYSD